MEGPRQTTADPETAARELCEARRARYEAGGAIGAVELVASFPERAAVAADSDERRGGPGYTSALRGHDSDETVAVCYFDSDGFGVMPGPDGKAPPGAFRRLREVVTADGMPFLLAGGKRSEIEPVALEVVR